MKYTVIERDPKTRKEKILLRTNNKQKADEIIETNHIAYIKYDKSAISLVNAPVAKKQRDLSPIESLPMRRFPNSITTEQKKTEYEVYNNV